MTRRQRRKQRRQRRWAHDDSRESRLMMATTVFAFAAFGISLGRKVMGFWDGAMWESLGLMGFGFALTFFGALLLLRVDERSRAQVAAWTAIALVGLSTSGWIHLGGLSPGWSASMLLPAENPLDSAVPRVERAGLSVPDAPLVAFDGRDGLVRTSHVMSEMLSKDQIGSELEQVIQDRQHSAQLLGYPVDRQVTLAVDRCLDYGEFSPLVRTVLDSGEGVLPRLLVVDADRFGALSAQYVRETESPSVRLVFHIERDMMQLSVDGKPIQSDGCAGTFCPIEGQGCDARWDWPWIRKHVDALAAQHGAHVFTAHVEPDVSVQTIVSLVDTVSRPGGPGLDAYLVIP